MMRILLLSLCCGALYAQQRAQLMGLVRDSSGAVVPETDVAVFNMDTGIRRSTRTDQYGVYAVSSLTPGNYKITIRRPGFRTIARTGIVLAATERARLDFLLEIGGIEEVVTVTGGASAVETNDASSLLMLQRDSLDRLPLNSAGLRSVVEFAPGVVATPATRGEAGQFSSNGQRPNTNYFTIDGVSGNNAISGSGLPGEFSGGALPGMTAIGSLHGLASTLELDEVRIQTSTFAPEFGRLPGAQVSVITRGGSNQLHGEIVGAFRHHALNAADPFLGRAGGTKRGNLASAGGRIAGPLIPNRTFYAASMEWMRLDQTSVWRMAVPSAEARWAAVESTRTILNAFPLPMLPLNRLASEHVAYTNWPGRFLTNSFRIDHAVSSNVFAFARYVRTPSESRAGYMQLNDSRLNAQAFTAGVLHSFSPAVTNDSRISVSTVSAESSWEALSPIDLRSAMPPLSYPGRRLYALSIRGYGQFLHADPAESRQTQWNLIHTTAIQQGPHQFRLGLEYQRQMPRRDRPISGVAVEYASLDDVLSGIGPSVNYLQAAAGSSVIETLSFFAQDTWQVKPRLNVTYGTRWELTPAPSYRARETAGGQDGNVVSPPFPPAPGVPPMPRVVTFPSESFTPGVNSTPIWKTRYSQFAPRLAAAYQLDAEGKTVLRAGAGLFYDLNFNSVVDILNGTPFNRWVVPLTAGLPAPTADRSLAYGYAPELRLPRSLHWNIAVERSVAASTVLSAAYVGSRATRMLRLERAAVVESSQPQLVLATNHGQSQYHSLQVQARRNLARGLRGFLSYTWAHSIDNGSWGSASYLLYSGSTDRGPSDFDVRHSLRGALTMDWRNWTLTPVIRARTAFPVDVIDFENAFGLRFDNQRPDTVSGVPVWIDDASVPNHRRLNPAAFRRARPGIQGTLGRNAIRGFGLAQVDVSLERRFTIAERSSVSFGVEAYNLANRPSYGDPVRFLGSPLFGQSASGANLMLGTGRAHSGLTPALQAGGPRSIQMKLNFRF